MGTEWKTAGINKHRSTGFSLIEVLVALSLFVVLSSGIASGILLARQTVEKNLFETTVYALVSSYLEQIQGLEYSLLEEAGNGASIELPTRLTIPGSIAENGSESLQTWKTNHLEVIIDLQRERRILGLALTPRIQSQQGIPTSDQRPVLGINIDFEWLDPATGRTIQRTLGTAKSQTRSF